MLPARPNRFISFWFDRWCRRALRQQFVRLHLYDPARLVPPTELVSLSPVSACPHFDPSIPRLYVANHSSFWDGVLLNYVLRNYRPQPRYVMIEQGQIL